MKEMDVPIDQAGRIVLPKDVRQELALKPGDRLKLSIDGLSVTLTPNRGRSGFVRKGRALVFAASDGEKLGEDAVQSILEEMREGRHEPCLPGMKPARRKR